MIRPELIEGARRWAEPFFAAAATLMALWVVGASNLRWGWLSALLGAIILFAGALWVREAVRRVRLAHGGGGGGTVYIEERRILHIGSLGNVQIDLDDVSRIDLAISKPDGKSWASVLLHTNGPPAAIPLNADGQDALLDALCTLPGFRLEDLDLTRDRLTRAGGRQPLVTIWRRHP